MIRPSMRRSVCSNSQICTFCRLCKNRNIKFCRAATPISALVRINKFQAAVSSSGKKNTASASVW